MDRYPFVIAYSVITVVTTLAIVILAVVFVLLHGLFTPTVNNADIFKLIGPPFISIVGGFTTIMGALAGYIAGRAETGRKDLAPANDLTPTAPEPSNGGHELQVHEPGSARSA